MSKTAFSKTKRDRHPKITAVRTIQITARIQADRKRIEAQRLIELYNYIPHFYSKKIKTEGMPLP